MARKRFYDYRGERLAVRFEPGRCIHAEECIRGLPAVFDPDRRPWIDPDRAAADKVEAVVRRCPTGALQLASPGGEAAERPPAANTVRPTVDGPLYVRGRLRLALPEGELEETRVALCRCGASRNKPFCDNAHREAGFRDAGRLGSPMLAAADEAERESVLEISLAPDGPLLVSGPLSLEDAEASQTQSGVKGALCRCGASDNKPFCDGSHAAVGFAAE